MLGRFSFDDDTLGGSDAAVLAGAPSYAQGTPGAATPRTKTPSFSTGGSATLHAPTATASPAVPRGSAPAAPPTPDFSSLVNSLHSATDPVDQAQQHDALARQLFASLKAQGHDVKWQGSQLMVDGRPYTVAGASGATTAVPRGGTASGIAPGGPAPGSFPNAGGGPITPDNVDSISASDPRFNSQEYLDALNAAHPEYSGLPPRSTGPTPYVGHVDENQIMAVMRTFPNTSDGLRQAYAELEKRGLLPPGSKLEQKSTADEIYFPGVGWVDFFGGADSGHPGPWGWHVGSGATKKPAAGTAGGPLTLPPVLENALSRTTPAPVFNSNPAGAQSSLANGFTPGQGPTYTPGDIAFDDIPGLSYDDIYNQLTGDGDATEQASSALLKRLLENPDSIDAHTLDTMKARSKDELAEQQQMEEENLRTFGVSNGIDDSRWLQSERLASRRDRDRALTASNRDLEVTAATTNQADRRSAAQLGESYSSRKASNRQAAATLAADTVLRQSALRGDRMALREQVNQKAAELGISKDQVMSQWLLGLMDDATRRFGIETGANVDMAKLGEQSQEFKEDLAFRIMALEQQDRQFGASYGLDFLNTQGRLDQDQFNRQGGQ